MIRFFPFKFIIGKYVNHLQITPLILQKTSAQSAQAGPEPAILRITCRPSKCAAVSPTHNTWKTQDALAWSRQ